jgi:hypothetical protein
MVADVGQRADICGRASTALRSVLRMHASGPAKPAVSLSSDIIPRDRSRPHCLCQARSCRTFRRARDTARRKFGDERSTQFRRATAAVFQKKQHHVTKLLNLGAIHDDPAVPLRRHKPCPRQNVQMRRHGILRHQQCARDIPCRQPFRRVFHKQPKRLKAGWLRECCKSENCLFLFHISRLLEIWNKSRCLFNRSRLQSGIGITGSGTGRASRSVEVLGRSRPVPDR